MDEIDFPQLLSEKMNLDRKTVDTLLESLSKVLLDSVESMTSVAIPSFGTFTPVKYKEEIRTDLSTGKRMMFPPHIDMEFQPAASLRKKVTDSNE